MRTRSVLFFKIIVDKTRGEQYNLIVLFRTIKYRRCLCIFGTDIRLLPVIMSF